MNEWKKSNSRIPFFWNNPNEISACRFSACDINVHTPFGPVSIWQWSFKRCACVAALYLGQLQWALPVRHCMSQCSMEVWNEILILGADVSASASCVTAAEASLPSMYLDWPCLFDAVFIRALEEGASCLQVPWVRGPLVRASLPHPCEKPWARLILCFD